MDWMDHLNYIQAVADEDVRSLKEKEETYQGSWKRSGGRSAWFMLRRKIDRMLEMLKKPEDPEDPDISYILDCNPSEEIKISAGFIQRLRAIGNSEDIFLKIEEDPSGRDGSVLAEVRDLRRYLTLVEAEMISRGVVPRPQVGWLKTDDGNPCKSSGPISSMDMGEEQSRRVQHWGTKIGPGTPEDGGHHAQQQSVDELIEEQILAARVAQRAATRDLPLHKDDPHSEPQVLQDSDEWKRDYSSSEFYGGRKP